MITFVPYFLPDPCDISIAIVGGHALKLAVLFYQDIVVRTSLHHSSVSNDHIYQLFPSANIASSLPLTLSSQLTDYFNRTPVSFSCNLIASPKPFAQSVYAALATVSYSHTLTYAQLADLANSPNAARAVGSAMKNNPYPIIIPCHRVIKADNTPGYYSAAQGTATKEYLLNLEQQSGR